MLNTASRTRSAVGRSRERGTAMGIPPAVPEMMRMRGADAARSRLATDTVSHRSPCHAENARRAGRLQAGGRWRQTTGAAAGVAEHRLIVAFLRGHGGT